MSKIGISININVSKIDKTRLFQGKKGTYMELTTYIDPENPGQYGDHGFISQSTTKEEREAGTQTPILGNCKVFFVEEGQAAPAPVSEAAEFDDDIPFQPRSK